MIRQIDEHKVNPVNDQITINVLDTPSEGITDAPHEYEIVIPMAARVRLSFQHGPISEVGANGVTQEVLLAVVLDRLRAFQKGKFACRENALAITKIEEGLLWLQKRTFDRMRRGVEGTNAT